MYAKSEIIFHKPYYVTCVGGLYLLCEFEEKEYEQPLNYELAWKRRVWSPGQVFEKKLGFDAAIFSKNPRFWKLWTKGTRRTWKLGIKLDQELWNIIEETWKSNAFPKFKFNLFVQHKRPEYIFSHFGREYGYWNKPYFRYDLIDHQQDALDKLEQRVSSNGIVVYACPSFWKREDLWSFMLGKLIESSNFVQPHRLRGHKRYTFIQGGKNGQAFSDPEKIEGITLLTEIDKMFERSIEFENNIRFMNMLARGIRSAIQELEKKTRESYFALERAIGLPDHELGRNIMTTLIFTYFTNTTWGIGYDRNVEINHRIQALIDSL